MRAASYVLLQELERQERESQREVKAFLEMHTDVKIRTEVFAD